MKRYSVIQQTVRAALSATVAARMLGISPRQVFRIKANVRKHGADGVQHGNCGHAPANAKPQRLRQRVINLYRKECFDFNFAHFTETLDDEFDIRLSRETTRCWLRAEGLGPKQHLQPPSPPPPGTQSPVRYHAIHRRQPSSVARLGLIAAHSDPLY